MGNPHIVALPYPAQGHVIPLMELSQCLAKQGFKIKFGNTEYNHKRVLKALGKKICLGSKICVVSIPDGAVFQVMPGKLQELINRINMSGEERITGIITDWTMGWSLEVAEKMNIHRAIFWPASAAILCSMLSVSKLVNDGIIDIDGTALQNQKIQLAPEMPVVDTANFAWPGAFSFTPNILPVGPLLASNRLGDQVGYFWAEDSTCLKWLEKQPPNSVVYIAFGSFTVFDQAQFQELALRLINEAYSEGFQERVAARGKIVGWAPQQKVLSHPSVSCFLSHRGWNSTMEGVSNGMPFLCWPYFADQFLNGTLQNVEEGGCSSRNFKNFVEWMMA
ncbi:UDP-glycosyltransferase 83A [Salix suchowensis]|nr:UDP-glycosyltransferase 83A [Salix suchowensis]